MFQPHPNELLVSSNRKHLSDEHILVPKKQIKLNRSVEVDTASPIASALTPISTPNSGIATGTAASSQKLKRGRKLKLISKDGTANSIKKKKRGRKSVQENPTTASTSDEDEECSATNCVRPAGKHIITLLFFLFTHPRILNLQSF